MLHIGKYFNYVFHGALKILFYPHKARKYIKNKDAYPLDERYNMVRGMAHNAIFKMMKLKFDVRGLDKIDQNRTYLFTPNHQGTIDPVCLINVFEKPTAFVCKKEIEKFPIAGKIIKTIEPFFLDRENPRDALRMVNYCEEKLNQKLSVVIFPEGTRSKDKEVSIHSYKPGAFKCAYKTGVAIVPIVIDKTYIPLSSKRKNTDKVIKISFLDPIEYEKYKDLTTAELALEVENKAKEELDKLRKEENITK